MSTLFKRFGRYLLATLFVFAVFSNSFHALSHMDDHDHDHQHASEHQEQTHSSCLLCEIQLSSDDLVAATPAIFLDYVLDDTARVVDFSLSYTSTAVITALSRGPPA